MGALLAVQIVVTGICCGFYRVTPLEEGQGCIASPKHNWVGIYWLSATLLYTASFILALVRSFKSLEIKRLSYWKLMLRDGLNLYGAIWLVNMVNMLYWFIITPTGISDPVKTIVTSMAAVLTTSMTLRIILSVRGSLASGGSFAVSSTAHSHSRPSTHNISAHRPGGPQSNPVVSFQQPHQGTFTIGLDGKRDWVDDKNSESVGEGKEEFPRDHGHAVTDNGPIGVKVTIDTETDYEEAYRRK